jgi:hypothetical protein
MPSDPNWGLAFPPVAKMTLSASAVSLPIILNLPLFFLKAVTLKSVISSTLSLFNSYLKTSKMLEAWREFG